MKTLYVTQIKKHLAVEVEEEFYLTDVSTKHVLENESSYLSLILEDRTGRILGRIWENNIEESHFNLKGKIVKINGEVLLDQNQEPELIIWKMTPAIDYDIHNFIKGLSPEETDHYVQILKKQIRLVDHIGYKKVLEQVYNQILERIKIAPISITGIGNYNGGLLVQTTAVTSIAIQIMRSQDLFAYFPERKLVYMEDLLITGSLLFGIGIIDLYSPFPEAQRVGEYALLSKSLLSIQQLYKLVPNLEVLLTLEEINLLIHMLQMAYSENQKFHPMNREALILSIAYQTYRKITQLEMQFRAKSGETGAVYDTDFNNYLYIPRDLENGGIFHEQS